VIKDVETLVQEGLVEARRADHGRIHYATRRLQGEEDGGTAK